MPHQKGLIRRSLSKLRRRSECLVPATLSSRYFANGNRRFHYTLRPAILRCDGFSHRKFHSRMGSCPSMRFVARESSSLDPHRPWKERRRKVVPSCFRGPRPSVLPGRGNAEKTNTTSITDKLTLRYFGLLGEEIKNIRTRALGTKTDVGPLSAENGIR